MANSGKELEEFVKAIESVFLPAGFKITSRERIYDDQNDQIAELDVFITGTLGTTKINWLIECRDRPSMGPAPRSWIEQLYGRLIGLKLSKVTAVSTTSFSPGAVKFAKDHGIELRTVQEITQDQIKTWFIAATLTVNNVIGQMKQVRAFLIPGADDKQLKQFNELLQNSNNHSKIFESTITEKRLSLNDIWDFTMRQMPTLGVNIQPNSTPVTKTITANYTNPKYRFKVNLQGKDMHITRIDFIADLRVISSNIPIGKITQYRPTTEKEPIAESIHFQFSTENDDLDLAIHKVTNQSDTKLIVTRTTIPKAKKKNEKLN